MNDRLDSRPATGIASSKRSFRRLLGLFVGKMFQGGGELGADDLDLGIGITAILLALPGLFVSLLLFEKYGSLIRFLRGDGSFDPFEATIPDEYFFIVLSMAITGIATLWKWTAIFPDRRDFANLVHLPISLRNIFVANFAAIAALASLYAIVVNAASIILFPIVVVGSQGSLAVFMRFFLGHSLTVIAAGFFSFCLVFALTGILLALFPYGISRRISTVVRFVVIVFLLALVASSLSVPDFLSNGVERRSFQKIPESADLPLIPKLGKFRWASLSRIFYRSVFKTPTQRTLGRFILPTLWRSEIHQQVLLFSLAIGLVASAGMLAGVPIHFQPGSHRFYQTNASPLSADALSIPLILAFCVIVGMRFCFEIPLNLQANWIFRFWIDPAVVETRSTARRLLLALSLSWLAPLTFFSTLYLWGLFIAVLHTSVLIVCSILIVEIAILRLRKIPFTCSYPPFQSHSPLIVLAYFFAAIILATYIPEYETQVAATPAATPLLFVPFALILLGLHHYRKNMLPMDKELIFEEPQNNWT